MTDSRLFDGRQINRDRLPFRVRSGAGVETQVVFGADHADGIADRFHRILPALVIDLDAQQHKQFSAVDLAFLVHLEYAVHQRADFDAAVSCPFTKALVDQAFGDLDFRADIYEVRHLQLQLVPAIKRSQRDIAFAAADLRVAPASPGKAERLLPFLNHQRATLYVNLEEASLLCQREFATATDAAKGLLDRGAMRVLVTDGGNTSAEADQFALISQTPPEVLVTRVTGAGDTFMAAHIAAEAAGDDRDTALSQALRAAANYVSGETPL